LDATLRKLEAGTGVAGHCGGLAAADPQAKADDGHSRDFVEAARAWDVGSSCAACVWWLFLLKTQALSHHLSLILAGLAHVFSDGRTAVRWFTTLGVIWANRIGSCEHLNWRWAAQANVSGTAFCACRPEGISDALPAYAAAVRWRYRRVPAPRTLLHIPALLSAVIAATCCGDGGRWLYLP